MRAELRFLRVRVVLSNSPAQIERRVGIPQVKRAPSPRKTQSLVSAFALCSLPFFGLPVVNAQSATPPPTVTADGATWTEVSTAAQLLYMDANQSQYLKANIELMNSINLSGANWTPLGSGSSFSGTFQGNGFTVSGWTVYTTTMQAGFFSTVSGTVENLAVDGQVSDSNPSPQSGADGLAGESTGTLSNVSANVSVTDGTPGVVTAAHAGGLVGGQSAGTISTGGLVGVQVGGTIQQSYATGAVTGGSAAYYTGGLVGYQVGPGTVIDNSYALGAVQSDNENGGLVGQQYGTITDAYTAGPVSGSSEQGGLVGYRAGGTIMESFYDTRGTG